MISYLQAENLTKSFGELVLFENISFGIDKDQKIAIIAKNGTGKTSLLNILAGKDNPDSGKISKRNDITIGYLEQLPQVDEMKTVMQQVFTSANKVVEVIQEYETALQTENSETMQTAIEKMDFHKAWDYEQRIKQILTQLNITDFKQKVGELSGGQKKRLALANLLINEPDLLILDEPTNHLDLQVIEWLEEYMQKTRSTILIVTHDRYFLDRVCDTIIEIDNNTVYKYNGNYSYFLEKREERISLHNQSVEKAQNLLRTELDWVRRMPKARGTKAKYRLDNFDKLKEKSQGRIEDKTFDINIKESRMGNKIIELYDISKSFGAKKVVDNFSYKFMFNEKIGVVGENGSGKTTFLNLVSQQLASDTGHIEQGKTVVVGYYKQQGIKFSPEKKVIDIIKDVAEIISLGNGKQMSALQFLEHFLFPTKMHYNRVEKLSGGEKRRLYLMTILMKNPNFLILDEPTNDLDIMTLSVLENYLQSYKGCLLIVSHDRYFMDKVVDNLFVFEKGGKIKNFVGTYSQYFYDKKNQEKKLKQSDKKTKPEKQKPTKNRENKLSYKEKVLFEQLEKEIPELETQIADIETLLNSGTLDHTQITEKAKQLANLKDQLDEKELTWLELSEKDG